MKKTAILLPLVILAACAAVKLTQPAPSELEKMQQKVPSITYGQALSGFNLYRSKCNGCHGLHRPAEFTMEKWEKILPEMLAKAKLSDPQEKENLTNYLKANSK